MADWERKRNKCPQCGMDRDECSDPDRDWFPQRTICWATVQQRVAERRYDLAHSEMPYHDGTETFWSKEPGGHYLWHYLDGVNIWVSEHDLTPEDRFI